MCRSRCTSARRSEEHTSELQSRQYLVCRLLLDTAPTEIYTLSLHDALPIFRASPVVQQIYIGSGVAALASRPRGHAERAIAASLLTLDDVNAFYGKSHIVKDVSLAVHEREKIGRAHV